MLAPGKTSLFLYRVKGETKCYLNVVMGSVSSFFLVVFFW